MSHAFLWCITFAVCLTSSLPAQDDWIFLSNNEIKVGIKKTAGGAIGWLSEANSDRNLINHHDQGRLIQQSYYGHQDGSMWADKPWRWNPVQGGGYQGQQAKILELQADDDSLFVKTLPKHWASGVDLPEVIFEQTITLAGPVVKIQYHMVYTGTVKHPVHDQEIPAVFLDRSLSTLVFYDGNEPFMSAPLRRIEPGFPNERYRCSEHWVAYVEDGDNGVGVAVPQADEFTCYRFGAADSPGACSYFAPLVRFAIEPEFEFEYVCFVTIGPLEQIRDRFVRLQSDDED